MIPPGENPDDNRTPPSSAEARDRLHHQPVAPADDKAATARTKNITMFKGLQQAVGQHKQMLERLRDVYADVELPDPGKAFEGDPGASFGAKMFLAASTSRFRIDNDIEVLETTIAMLDQVVDHIAAGRDDEAKALFATLGDLGRQFSQWPRRQGK